MNHSVEDRLNLLAASDAIARLGYSSSMIGRETPIGEIMRGVAVAIQAGKCAKLGRLALQAWPNSPEVRDLASDDDSSRSDPELWKRTARVRRTTAIFSPAEAEAVAKAFVMAWFGDHGRGAAPQWSES